MAEAKTLVGFVKYLLNAIGDPQLAFASYVDSDPRGGRDLADILREHGIEISKIKEASPSFSGEHEAPQASAPKALWQVPESNS